MATLAQTALTLSDWAKRVDPERNVDVVVELLMQVNDILPDMLWLEGNTTTGHRTTVRTDLPKGYWRLLNQGIPREKSTTAQITESTGMLEAYSVVDKDLADLNGQRAAFRASEDKGFIEGLSQTMAQTLFYGNVQVNPDRFTGMSPRYSDLSAGNKDNIIDGGGTGSNNTSIWLISWGDTTVHGIFPKGSTAGLQHRDLGEDTVTDSNSREYQALRTHFQWKAGLVVRDWRYAVRVANIDVTQDVETIANAKKIIGNMIRAAERLHQNATGRTAFYMNRQMRELLRLAILEKVSHQLTWESMPRTPDSPSTAVAGGKVMMFDGFPVRRVDQLLSTEAQVT